MKLDLLIIISIFFFSYIIKMLFMLHIFQQNMYNCSRYIRWCKKNSLISFSLMEFLPFIVWVISPFFVDAQKMVFFTQIILFYYLFYSLYQLSFFIKNKYKKPLIFTHRILRMFTTLTILFFLFSYIVIFIPHYFNNNSIIYFLVLFLIIINLLAIFLIVLSSWINYPIEYFIYKKYIKKAREKIKNLNNLDVIAITGSYGKTSTKYILTNILNEKFYPCMTPSSYNTPMGIAKTINNDLKMINDIFICEMGAYKQGEIKELCDIVNPKYAILTSIGEQHLDTFKNIENIIKTKFELIEYLPKGSIAILNYDNNYIKDKEINNKNVKVIKVGSNNNNNLDYKLLKYTYSTDGSEFEVMFPNNNIYLFRLNLLGYPNIINTLCSIALADQLGVSVELIQKGLVNLKQVPHRLELKKYDKYIIIDDAYNANPKGTKYAIDVLNNIKVSGKKIVITPGMVELGNKTKYYNYEYGKYIENNSDVDIVIIVGEENSNDIQRGLKTHNKREVEVIIVKDIYNAFQKLNNLLVSDSIVLLANDLPDVYK